MLVKSLLSKLSLVISQISDPPAELDGCRGDLFKAAGGEGHLIFIVFRISLAIIVTLTMTFSKKIYTYIYKIVLKQYRLINLRFGWVYIMHVIKYIGKKIIYSEPWLRQWLSKGKIQKHHLLF